MIRLGGLICSLRSFLQLNMCQELQNFAVVYTYSGAGCLVRLCDSDFRITSVDDITIGITCAAFCFHIAHVSFASSWYLFCLSLLLLLFYVFVLCMGRDSLAGIETCCGLESSGIESRWGEIFHTRPDRPYGHQPLCSGYRVFPNSKVAGEWCSG